MGLPTVRAYDSPKFATFISPNNLAGISAALTAKIARFNSLS